MGFEKSTNLFETETNSLPDYLLRNFLTDLFITFRYYYYAIS